MRQSVEEVILRISLMSSVNRKLGKSRKENRQVSKNDKTLGDKV